MGSNLWIPADQHSSKQVGSSQAARPAGIYAKISRIKLPHPRLPSNNPDTSLWELGPGESDRHLRNNGQDFYLICTRKRVNIWTWIKEGPQIKLDYLGIVPVKGEGGVFIPILFFFDDLCSTTKTLWNFKRATILQFPSNWRPSFLWQREIPFEGKYVSNRISFIQQTAFCVLIRLSPHCHKLHSLRFLAQTFCPSPLHLFLLHFTWTFLLPAKWKYPKKKPKRGLDSHLFALSGAPYVTMRQNSSGSQLFSSNPTPHWSPQCHGSCSISQQMHYIINAHNS